MNRSFVRLALPLWLIAIPLAWLGWNRPDSAGSDHATRFPVSIGGFAQAEEYELSASTMAQLGATDATQRRYQRGAESVFTVVVFHGANWKSVHPPTTCLRGSNLEFETETVGLLQVGERQVEVGRLAMHGRNHGRGYLCLYAYLAPPDFVAGRYTSFLLRHLPRALLRVGEKGSLIRVETWVDGDDWQAAEQRCGDFLRAAIAVILEELS